MLDELVDVVLPRGVVLAIGVALGAAFSKELRPAAKQAIKLAMTAGTVVQEAAAEALERGQDLVAEARYEHEQARNGQHPAATQPAASGRTARRNPASE